MDDGDKNKETSTCKVDYLVKFKGGEKSEPQVLEEAVDRRRCVFSWYTKDLKEPTAGPGPISEVSGVQNDRKAFSTASL